MKRYRTAGFALLLALCLLCAQLTAFAAAPEQGPNLVRYIPYPHSAEDRDKAHTIHWARGITPPTMPGQILEDGSLMPMKEADFTMIDVNDNPTTPDTNKTAFGYYLAEYQAGKGWYDVDKNHFYAPERGINDENACYAAAASNVISWWLDQNRDNIEAYLAMPDIQQHPELADPALLRGYLDAQENGFPSTDPKYSKPYDLLLRGFHSVGNYDGGHIHAALDPFFNGYLPRVMEAPNRPDAFTPFSEGGFFYPVFGLSPLSYESWYVRYDVLNPAFKGYFDEGYGVAIGYRHLGGAHAVAVWGAEYDENDNLCALYITDSNDAGELRMNYRNWDKKNCVGSMRRYACYPDKNGIAALGSHTVIDPGKGSFLYSVCLLDSAGAEWDYFLENRTPMYPDGRGLITYDDYLRPAGMPQWSLSFANAPSAFPTGTVSLQLDVKYTGEEGSAAAVLASYDQNGQMLEVQVQQVTAAAETVSLSVHLDNGPGRIASVRAFLLDEHQTPLTKAASLPAA